MSRRFALVVKVCGAIIAAVLFLVIGLTATRAKDSADRTDSKFESTVIKGRIGTCKSSTQLRDLVEEGRLLWIRVEELLVPLDSVTARPLDDPDRQTLLDVRAAVDTYTAKVSLFTATNPNCDLLTKAQRIKALGKK